MHFGVFCGIVVWDFCTKNHSIFGYTDESALALVFYLKYVVFLKSM